MRLTAPIPPALAAAVLAGSLALGACAAPFTGPVEITRFVGPDQAALGRGTISVSLADGPPDDLTRAAFVSAVGEQLSRLGYTVVPQGAAAQQSATIRTSRAAIASAQPARRGPVSVGVGGQTGGWGSGVGMGVGINLGGGQRGPNVNTELAVRINDAAGRSLWEGRAQMATAVKSPYSQPSLAARTLASGLFRGFPGGNGETITIRASELQPAP
ncbi:MAG: hypothetical protein ACK4IS_10930 [Erythrobacter sp.]